MPPAYSFDQYLHVYPVHIYRSFPARHDISCVVAEYKNLTVHVFTLAPERNMAPVAFIYLLLWCYCVLPTNGFGTAPHYDGKQSMGPSSFSNSGNAPTNNRAIVVGAGPAGLATALVLARNHSYHVTVLEASAESTIAGYDPTMAYLYNINGRGQVLTQRFPALQRGLETTGVPVQQFQILTVPGDPNECFTNVPFSRPMSKEEKERIGILYWIPRHELVKLFLTEVSKEQNIELHFGVKFENFTPCLDGLQVDCTSDGENGDSVKLSYQGKLVVGADGLNSRVRNQLATSHALFEGWRGYSTANAFVPRAWKTPSVGLRVKTLQLEPNFLIPVGDGSTLPVNSTANYQIRSVNTGFTDQISLVLLPMRSSSAMRSCVICTLPNHDLWKITSGPDMKAWFQRAFPRFSFDDSIVTDSEWKRFAQAQGSRFPPCQLISGLAISSSEGYGVVLVGDAIHAFPPDLGQGVNSALGDVAVLDDCMSRGCGLGDALAEYEAVRLPESRALIRLARHGAPYQYRQASLELRCRRFLWSCNILIRLFLHKVSKGCIAKPAILQMMDPNVPFAVIMRRADLVTVGLWSVLVLLFFRFAG